MSHSTTFFADPAIALSKTFLNLAQLLFAVGTAVFGWLSYLAFQGKIIDWDIQLNFSFWKYQPEPNSIFWHTLIFGMMTVACLIAFFLSRWLGKKI
jgi:hypothetical protein